MHDARDASLSLSLSLSRTGSPLFPVFPRRPPLRIFMRVSMGKGSAQLGRDAR